MPTLESAHIIMYLKSDDCTETSVTPEPRLCVGFQNRHINAVEEVLLNTASYVNPALCDSDTDTEMIHLITNI